LESTTHSSIYRGNLWGDDLRYVTR
jgi:hypothetical protein